MCSLVYDVCALGFISTAWSTEAGVKAWLPAKTEHLIAGEMCNLSFFFLGYWFPKPLWWRIGQMTDGKECYLNRIGGESVICLILELFQSEIIQNVAVQFRVFLSGFFFLTLSQMAKTGLEFGNRIYFWNWKCLHRKWLERFSFVRVYFIFIYTLLRFI